MKPSTANVAQYPGRIAQKKNKRSLLVIRIVLFFLLTKDQITARQD